MNLSQVHYDDEPNRALGSATALSTIIHPFNPHCPSMHMHISWTEMKSGKGYWRLMADLNPSLNNPQDKQRFDACLREVSRELYEYGSEQGDRYFYIPALGRHRGVSHFYLEEFNLQGEGKDIAFARAFGEAVIDCYCELLQQRFRAFASADDYASQLAYHTLYFLQVLTLDRGTTAGLMVHEQNDLGILGSIPSHVDRELLGEWVERLPSPQDKLLRSLIACLPKCSPAPVSDATKLQLAKVIRKHYHNYPEGLEMQARGNIIADTLGNHDLKR
ncbi:coproporphyrinogen III oxidase [Dongshaea marina]|uniref:coproporphyrinogen III oxidase n=1 Tax=Dongshaea marina TaxID=2047966 RepID=UPI00190278AF|nr:coproporphyrinogen III oxidase [Dongshaea marina]